MGWVVLDQREDEPPSHDKKEKGREEKSSCSVGKKDAKGKTQAREEGSEAKGKFSEDEASSFYLIWTPQDGTEKAFGVDNFEEADDSCYLNHYMLILLKGSRTLNKQHGAMVNGPGWGLCVVKDDSLEAQSPHWFITGVTSIGKKLTQRPDSLSKRLPAVRWGMAGNQLSDNTTQLNSTLFCTVNLQGTVPESLKSR
eukprot:Gb_03962 [translate_table: standard]